MPKCVLAKGFSKLEAFTDELELALKADALHLKKDRRTARALFAQIKASGYVGGYAFIPRSIWSMNWRRKSARAKLGVLHWH